MVVSDGATHLGNAGMGEDFFSSRALVLQLLDIKVLDEWLNS